MTTTADTATRFPVGSQVRCLWPGAIFDRYYTVVAHTAGGKVLICRDAQRNLMRVELGGEIDVRPWTEGEGKR